MLAFHNDPKIKEKYLLRVSAHEKADEIIKGKYWENGKGCAVGCTVHSDNHSAYEAELGIPQVIARLEDGIFESIPDAEAKTWPRRFLEAIKPGADLSLVWPKFAVWLLTDDEFGIIKFAKSDAQREAIQTISDMYLFKIEGAEIDSADWLEARNAAAADASSAYAAYASSAYASAAADASSAYAADAAAAYASYAYAYASSADASAAYASSARTKWRLAQMNKLLELLSEADSQGESK